MGKKHAKTGGASMVMKKQMERKAAKAAPRPVESDEESEESGNYMTFDKKRKDSDDEEEDREIFNLALDKDDDEVRIVCNLPLVLHEAIGNDYTL
jgi:protein tyrosine/serine phosphatase